MKIRSITRAVILTIADLKAVREFFQGGFFNAGNIGARNAELLCHIPLRHGGAVVKTVAQDDDAAFPRVQPFVDKPERLAGVEAAVDVFGDRVLAAHDVLIGQRIAVPVGVDCFIQRNFAGQLFL